MRSLRAHDSDLEDALAVGGPVPLDRFRDDDAGAPVGAAALHACARRGARFGRRGGGGAPSRLDPLIFDAANLIAQWRPDSGITLASTKVSDWVDRKSARTVTQGTDADRPVFSASDSGLGGRPAVIFSTAAASRLGGSGFASIAQPYHVGIVMRFTDTSGTEAVLDDNGGGNADAPLVQHNATDWQVSNGVVLTGTQARSTSARAILVTLNGASSAIYANNDWTTALAAGNAGAGAWTQLLMGSSGTGTNAFDGAIGEVFVLSSLANLASWRAYLLQRYGITVA